MSVVKRITSLVAVALVGYLSYSLMSLDAAGQAQWIALGAMAVACILVSGWPQHVEAPAPAPQKVETAPPPAPAVEELEPSALDLLSVLQTKGRLVDFLMDDVSRYSDTQVAAAARVVHRGCASVIREHLALKPLLGQNEGSEVEVPSGYSPNQYRLTGSVVGQAPFRGRLVHRGWTLERANLPRQTRERGVVAPAEVEV